MFYPYTARAYHPHYQIRTQNAVTPHQMDSIGTDINNILMHRNFTETLNNIIDKISECNSIYTEKTKAAFLIKTFIGILKGKYIPINELELCIRCIRSYVQILPGSRSIFFSIDNLEIIIDCFYNLDNAGIRDDSITIINQISMVSPKLLSFTSFFSNLNKAFCFLDKKGEKIMKRTFLNTLENVCAEDPNNAAFVNSLPNLSDALIKFKNDQQITDRIIKILCLISNNNSISANILAKIGKSFTSLLSEKNLQQLIDLFLTQISKFANYESVASSNIDFEDLLLSNNPSSHRNYLQSKYCILIREISTPLFFIKGTFPKSESQRLFSVKAQKIIIKTIERRPLSPQELIQALISTMQYQNIKLTPSFISSLFHFARKINYSGAVCYLCHYFINDPLMNGYYLYSVAEKTTLSGRTPSGSIQLQKETINAFSSARTNYSKKVIPNTCKKILASLDCSYISISELMYQGCLKNCLNNMDLETVDEYKRLEKYLTQCLDFISFDRVNETFIPLQDFSNFLNEEKQFLIKCEDRIIASAFKPSDSVAFVIGTLMQALKKDMFDERRSIMKTELWKYLRYFNTEDMAAGTYLHLIDESNLVLVSDDGTEFGPECSMLDLIVSNVKKFGDFKLSNISAQHATLTEKNETFSLLLASSCPLSVNEKCLFDLLKVCNEKCPLSISQSFIDMLETDMKNFGRSVTLNSSSFYIMNNYSFLLPEKLRMLALHTQIFQSGARLREVANYFNFNMSNILPFPYDCPLKIVVPRTGIFEIIKEKLIDAFKGPLQIDVQFENEVGTGRGPTKEFFTLFMKEVINPAKEMFRQVKNGYFPSPNANPNDFYIVGVVIGKAIAMDCITGVTIAPEFFKLVKGDNVTEEEVDPDICNLLKNKENFIGEESLEVEYEFPSCSNFLKGGVVTRDNVDEYVKDVYDNIINKNILDASHMFKEGLQSVIPGNIIMKLLSADDISTVVCGEDDTMFSIEELAKYTLIDFGYTVNSPQVQWVFQFITTTTPEKRKKFIHFVTANEYLPVGGFAALNPHFTIFKMDTDCPDKYCPQASTCTSLLKLPEYSSKENFIKMLEKAMEYGEDNFALE